MLEVVEAQRPNDKLPELGFPTLLRQSLVLPLILSLLVILGALLHFYVIFSASGLLPNEQNAADGNAQAARLLSTARLLARPW
jgi:hypothetical protein